MDTSQKRKKDKKKDKKSKKKKLTQEQPVLNKSDGEDEVQYGTKAVEDVLNEAIEDKGRPWTVSVALPGSILDNAQSLPLRTYLAGQIARALVVFNVDEVIVFDESGYDAVESTEGTFQGIGRKGNANVQLARILQYLECPQYLRKNFFPKHPDLQYAGVLNPLDCPHHMRADALSSYREGVVLKKQIAVGKGSYVDVGKTKEVQIDKQLQPGLRVTVRMNEGAETSEFKHCKVVPPSEPRTNAGLYWGYSVRLASSLGAVFTSCPYKDGYDLTIGTSEKGENVDDVELPEFRHLLVVFGGLKGLENSLEADEKLEVPEPSLLFDHYLNTCPNQGSGTIRTEEAILVTMSILRSKILQAIS
ncbi:putative methyltransferase C9orf114 [Amphiura filiformis]|uniref:putative methyltransferase C9orf114 n=1 Tax=Amphiura filiformis TaxID=82378 RepID=UPI003B21DE87